MITDEYETSTRGLSPNGDGFAIEDLMCGTAAHGLGRTGDGRTSAFQVERAGLRLGVYRADLRGAVPYPEDVVSVQRSVSALVQDATVEAVKNERRPEQQKTIRAFLTRLDSVIDGI